MGRHVLPGVIDPHVQLYPGPEFAHYATETGSAALGGVTTIVKMHRDLGGYDAGTFRAEVARRREPVTRRLRVPSGDHDRRPDRRDPRLRARVRHHLVQVLHRLQGRGGRPRSASRGWTTDSCSQRSRRVAATGGVALVHCENQELAAAARLEVERRGGDGLRAFAEQQARGSSKPRRSGASRSSPPSPAAALYVVHVTSKEGARGPRGQARRRPARLHRDRTALPDGDRRLARRSAREGDPADPRAGGPRGALGRARGGEIDAIGSDHVSAVRERKGGTDLGGPVRVPGRRDDPAGAALGRASTAGGSRSRASSRPRARTRRGSSACRARAGCSRETTRTSSSSTSSSSGPSTPICSAPSPTSRSTRAGALRGWPVLDGVPGQGRRTRRRGGRPGGPRPLRPSRRRGGRGGRVSAGTELRRILGEPGCAIAAGAYDPAVAKLVEHRRPAGRLRQRLGLRRRRSAASPTSGCSRSPRCSTTPGT